MANLILTAFTYGPNERRVEVDIRPPIPEGLRGNVASLTTWAQGLLMKMGKDLKHTNQWGCEICGKPSRETRWDVASWLHLAEPRLVIYIHHVCDAGKNDCTKELDKLSQIVPAGLRRFTPPSESNANNQANDKFPLAASCCNCEKDTTAVSDMSRCGGCKLVRYCSVQCQTEDWKRHKKVCKIIKNVKWVNWD